MCIRDRGLHLTLRKGGQEELENGWCLEMPVVLVNLPGRAALATWAARNEQQLKIDTEL